jgi:hypothetical protein
MRADQEIGQNTGSAAPASSVVEKSFACQKQRISRHVCSTDTHLREQVLYILDALIPN